MQRPPPVRTMQAPPPLVVIISSSHLSPQDKRIHLIHRYVDLQINGFPLAFFFRSLLIALAPQ
ncbi:hypothetical protein E2C01_002410 [Portunus trituberculatus]|uniref:Uncharacterized protein n=1 Tax=Portunus trituberculatus TaxID=210409 RepID=A0A5B7CJB1_PORTR|nr:hypothetical protein [Portunus trituberculatus]